MSAGLRRASEELAICRRMIEGFTPAVVLCLVPCCCASQVHTVRGATGVFACPHEACLLLKHHSRFALLPLLLCQEVNASAKSEITCCGRSTTSAR